MNKSLHAVKCEARGAPIHAANKATARHSACRAVRTRSTDRRVCCEPMYQITMQVWRWRVMVRRSRMLSPPKKAALKILIALAVSDPLGWAVPELPGLTALPRWVHAHA